MCPHGHKPERGEIAAIFSCEQIGFLKMPVPNFYIFPPPQWSLPSQKAKSHQEANELSVSPLP